MSYRVITADNHVWEAPDTFDRLPAPYRDRAPHIRRGEDGGDGWSFDGQPPRRTFGLDAVAGRETKDYKTRGIRFDEMLPGCYQPDAHLADMSRDGIDTSVLYPGASSKTYELEDRDFALACLRAYNDWLIDDFCAADPARLIGMVLLPVDDGVDACLREIERIGSKGARAFFLPYWAKVPYWHPQYDDVWRAVAAAGAVVSIHRELGGTPPPGRGLWAGIETGVSGVHMAGAVERSFSGIAPLSKMIFAGVFTRHPGLKVIDGEVDAGWIPYWAQKMDTAYETTSAYAADVAVDRRPSEFIGTNVFTTVLDDQVAFRMAGEYRFLRDAAMFAVDYPHSATLWPRTQEHLATLTEGMEPDDAQAILATNAVRVFGLAEA